MNHTCAEDIPAPQTPRISTSTGQSFDVHDDLSSEIFSRPSVISVTDSQLSSCSKREETSSKQKPWLDLSFLARAGSQEDSYAVPDEQDTYLSHSHDYAPSCLKLPGVLAHWQRYDDCAWQPGGWHRGETGAQWRIGHVMSKVPNEVQLGGDDVFVQAEGHAYHAGIGDPSHRRRRNPQCEQDPNPNRPLLSRRNALYKTRRPIVSHVTSTSLVADIPLADPNPSSEVSISTPHSVSISAPQHSAQCSSVGSNHDSSSCTSPESSIQIPRTTPLIPRCLSEASISTNNPGIPSSISQAVSLTSPVIDHNRKYAHHPSQIMTPMPMAPTYWDPYSVQPQEAVNAVVRNPRYRRLLRFFSVSSATPWL